MASSNHANPGHLFVSGPPRAGTTLLELVLSAHPDVCITPETHFIEKLLQCDLDPTKSLDPPQWDWVVDELRRDVKLNSWPKFSLDPFLDEVPRRNLSLAALMDRLFVHYAALHGDGASYVGNKKGLYTDGLGPYVKEIFPDAKFIAIVRDPRDVVRSMLINLAHDKLQEAVHLCYRRDRYIEQLRRRFPNDVHVLRYEDLVQDPEPVCRTLCQFLDLAYDDRMVRFYEANADESRLMGATRHIHKNTTSPFNPDLIGKWRDDSSFTASELQWLEAVLARYMARYGYERATSPGGLRRLTTGLRAEAHLQARELRQRLSRRTR